MKKVILDLSMSLDGYIAGSDVTPRQPMGVGGERLHEWIFKGKTHIDGKILEEVVSSSGAVIVGGRTYAIAIDDAWGGASPFSMPAFVVTNQNPEKAISGFTYVPEGVTAALDKAKEVAGEKNIWLMGGASIAQSFIKAGLVDEIHIHIIPVLLCCGTLLFEQIGMKPIELERVKMEESSGATHIWFRVVR
ncbi:dihydrofolate reductase family protein [Dyadobacter sp. LHD-138]|uniref:dihydrofolate reductase family protein n=1 Tax=Dyadobacter sp. LHD-138 TaxID=3071413 RepID=UPI0027E0A081|nr:dihydrofolate reductase family protein [Dyadobacter sp. LHD-138]MDQ6481396.1 dihydrofolate reductase family protein [Dyadobacter sp. LHD-138]